MQRVFRPTQEQGHTLDLVLLYGLSVFNLIVCDALFSDHKPVLFNITLPPKSSKPPAPARPCCIINPSTAGLFSAFFSQNDAIPEFLPSFLIQSSSAHSFIPPASLYEMLWRCQKPGSQKQKLNETTRAIS